MNFEQNTGVTYYSNPTLESRIKALEEKIKFLESKPVKVVLGATEYVNSNNTLISSTIQEDKSVILSYDLSNIMSGTDYKVLSADITVSGPDKNGNTARLTNTTNTKSTITLQPHNFPAVASVRAIVVKNGVQNTLYQAVSLPTPNFGEISFYLQNLVTQANNKEMTIQEALDYLLSRIESIK